MKVRMATWYKSKRNESTVVVKLFQDDVNISLHLMVIIFFKINKYLTKYIIFTFFKGLIKFIKKMEFSVFKCDCTTIWSLC